jgi:gliding motility-associated-like protein
MPNNINVGNSVSGNGFDIAFRVNPFITTQYNILAATLNECSIQLKNMASVIVNNCTVKMVNATGLIIPEGFSPDGDNINDYFEIKGIENYPNAEISIYNRWGTLIYSKKPYFNEWDGISSITKKMLPVGTYYYILNLKNRMKSIAGWIYLNKE